MMPEALVNAMVKGESLSRACVAGPLPGTGGISSRACDFTACMAAIPTSGRDGQLGKSVQPPGGWQAEGGAEAKL